MEDEEETVMPPPMMRRVMRLPANMPHRDWVRLCKELRSAIMEVATSEEVSDAA